MKLNYVKFFAIFATLYLVSSVESSPNDCVIEQTNCYARCPNPLDDPTCGYSCSIAAQVCLSQYESNSRGSVTDQRNDVSKKQSSSIYYLVPAVVLALAFN